MTMDDTKHYTMQIKGTAYRFKPLPAAEIERVVVIMNMNANQTKTLRVLSRVLSESAGPEQWDALTDRLIAGEVELTEITVDVFKRLLKKFRENVPADDAQ